jgi:hypothetical protein
LEENKKARKNRSVAFYHDHRLSRSGANLECNRSHIATVPCSREEAIASGDEDNEVMDCYHLKRLRVLAHDRTTASGGEIWTSDHDFADTLFQID